MSTLKQRQKSLILAALYILFIAMAVVCDAGLGKGSAGKALSLMTVVMAAGVLLITGDFTNLDTIFRFFVVYGIWFLIVLVYSSLIWISNFETVDFILRGGSKIMFQFVMLLNMAAAAYLFGEKGIHYMFWGTVIGNALITVVVLPGYAVSDIVSSVTHFLTSGGDAVGYMKELEIHDATFTYGFYLIYFIFFDKISSKKMKALNIAAAVFFFLLGMKRIALASLIVMLIAGFVLLKLSPRAQMFVMKSALYFALIAAFVYLISLKTNVFMKIMDQLNVDVMGRNVLYAAIDKYWRISPSYVGYGFEYVHVMMLELAESGSKAFNKMVDIHNDFMRVYIEMGFFGFIGWGLYTLIFQFNRINQMCGRMTVCLFFLCEMYIFVTYLTDNTLFYFYTGTVLRMLPLCYALHIDSGQAQKAGNTPKKQFLKRKRRKGIPSVQLSDAGQSD